MTSDQYRAALDRLGLTQNQAATIFGLSLRTCHGYANGDPVPKPIAMLLQLDINTLAQLVRISALGYPAEDHA